MKVSIIVPVHNRLENLTETFRCLNRQVIHYPHQIEVIIVDHASTDGTRQLISGAIKHLPQGVFVSLLERTKWSASIPRNAGAKAASKDSDAFIFIDSDILLPPDRIQRFIDDYSANPDPNRVIIGPYHYMNNHIKVDDELWYTHEITNYAQDVRWKSFEEHPVEELNTGVGFALACFGGSIMIPKNLFFKAGMYDEECVAGVEDGDFGLTLWETNAVFSLDKGLLGWHNYHIVLPDRTENIEEMKKYINEKHHMDIVFQTGEAYRQWGIEWADPLWKENENE